jgi:hypothetical protein
MLYSEIIAVCSQIHTKHTNMLCVQTVEFVNVKHGGIYGDHWAFKRVKQFRCLMLIADPSGLSV